MKKKRLEELRARLSERCANQAWVAEEESSAERNSAARPQKRISNVSRTPISISPPSPPRTVLAYPRSLVGKEREFSESHQQGIEDSKSAVEMATSMLRKQMYEALEKGNFDAADRIERQIKRLEKSKQIAKDATKSDRPNVSLSPSRAFAASASARRKLFENFQTSEENDIVDEKENDFVDKNDIVEENDCIDEDNIVVENDIANRKQPSFLLSPIPERQDNDENENGNDTLSKVNDEEEETAWQAAWNTDFSSKNTKRKVTVVDTKKVKRDRKKKVVVHSASAATLRARRVYEQATVRPRKIGKKKIKVLQKKKKIAKKTVIPSVPFANDQADEDSKALQARARHHLHLIQNEMIKPAAKIIEKISTKCNKMQSEFTFQRKGVTQRISNFLRYAKASLDAAEEAILYSTIQKRIINGTTPQRMKLKPNQLALEIHRLRKLGTIALDKANKLNELFNKEINENINENVAKKRKKKKILRGPPKLHTQNRSRPQSAAAKRKEMEMRLRPFSDWRPPQISFDSRANYPPRLRTSHRSRRHSMRKREKETRIAKLKNDNKIMVMRRNAREAAKLTAKKVNSNNEKKIRVERKANLSEKNKQTREWNRNWSQHHGRNFEDYSKVSEKRKNSQKARSRKNVSKTTSKKIIKFQNQDSMINSEQSIRSPMPIEQPTNSVSSLVQQESEEAVGGSGFWAVRRRILTESQIIRAGEELLKEGFPVPPGMEFGKSAPLLSSPFPRGPELLRNDIEYESPSMQQLNKVLSAFDSTREREGSKSDSSSSSDWGTTTEEDDDVV
eukprot:g376.t1